MSVDDQIALASRRGEEELPRIGAIRRRLQELKASIEVSAPPALPAGWIMLSEGSRRAYGLASRILDAVEASRLPGGGCDQHVWQKLDRFREGPRGQDYPLITGGVTPGGTIRVVCEVTNGGCQWYFPAAADSLDRPEDARWAAGGQGGTYAMALERATRLEERQHAAPRS